MISPTVAPEGTVVMTSQNPKVCRRIRRSPPRSVFIFALLSMVGATSFYRRQATTGTNKGSIGRWGRSYKECIKIGWRGASGRRWWKKSGIAISGKTIAYARVSQDKSWAAWVCLKFLSELPDEHAKVLSLVNVGLTPNFLKQHPVGQHLSRVLDHVF